MRKSYICKETSLLQRSNMSIEKDKDPSHTPAECYVNKRVLQKNDPVPKTLHTLIFKP